MQVEAVARLTPARLAASELLESTGAASLNALSTLRLVAVSGVIAAIIPANGHAANRG